MTKAKKNQSKKNTNTQNAKTIQKQDHVLEDKKEQILRFKELFPQYKSSTNDDILAVFEEFNNDFEAAIYGVMNGLVQNKPPEVWQSVSQKKKKKDKSHQNNRNYSRNDDRGRNKNRGTSQGNRNQSSSRGRYQSNTHSNSSRNTHSQSRPETQKGTQKTTASQNQTTSNPPRSTGVSVAIPPSSDNLSSKPSSTWGPPSSQEKKTTNQSPTPSVQNSSSAAPKEPTKNVDKPQAQGSPLSYANRVKTREPWNPTQVASRQSHAPVKEQKAPKKTLEPEVLKEESSPASHVQSTNAPAPTASSMNNQQPLEAPQQQPQQQQQQQPQQQQPRVTGVLLPGNFAGGDDSMSFQFGNLGISFNDEEIPASSAEKETLNTSIEGSRVSALPSGTSSATKKPENPQLNKIEGQQEQSEPQMSPMLNPYAHYGQPYPGMESDGPRGAPMMMPYYEHYGHTAGFQGRGEGNRSQRGGSNSSNYSGRSDASPASGKFNTEGAAPGSPTSSAAATGGYFYPPVFGHPAYVNPQFPGGQYPYQFYSRPGYHNFQNFSGNGMGYMHEDARGMSNYGGYPSPNAEGSSGRETSGSTKSSGTSKTQGGKGNQLETNFTSETQGAGYKNQGTPDYYGQSSDMYGVGNSFMGQYGYPQHHPSYPGSPGVSNTQSPQSQQQPQAQQGSRSRANY